MPAAWRGLGVAALLVVALLVVPLVGLFPAAARATSGEASPADAALSAARIATDQGFRTGVAVLDVQTGAYVGAGEDTAAFASESVVKVMIAARLLLTGQMTGDVEPLARDMISRSDDDVASALYGPAGGDDLIGELAVHYGIAGLGSPPSAPGWWGNTKITAAGLVRLYAAMARDPAVGPWLTDAMSRPSEYGADGTYQLFGLPAATSGAAVKQGWGADGDESANAVFLSTGYVGNGTHAVAILTEGPPDSYGQPISDVVTAQARALLPAAVVSEAQPPAAPDSSTAVPPTAPAGRAGATADGAPPTTPPRADLPLALAVAAALLAGALVLPRCRGTGVAGRC